MSRVLDWIEELQGADTRILIIVAAQKLDELITQLLKASMSHQGGGNDDLFGHDRPLGTFSSKILLAWRLGLIDRDFESFLQVLRKLRNDAAHSTEPMDLSKSPHIERIEHLRLLASKAPSWAITGGDDELATRDNPAAAVFKSLLTAIFNCECALLTVKPLSASVVCDFHRIGGRVVDDEGESSSGAAFDVDPQ